MTVLTEYERASGQAVNLNKSAITFGSRVQPSIKTRLRRILNIHNDGGCGKYLGLPEQIGRKKKEFFNFIVNKVQQRTQGWANRFLSEAGKEILIKTVALALPVYTMNCFKLPVGICEDINKLLAQFWWRKDANRQPMHWLAWKRMALPKSEGGLGFRDIESFNIAMLGKQAWRIMQSPNSLVSRVLKGRYFADTNLLYVGLGPKPSFIWRSILEGRDLVKSGVMVLIGDGIDTSIWNDSWLPTHPPRPPRRIENVQSNVTHVHQLLRVNPKVWDIPLLERLIDPEDVEIIKKIRLSNHPSPDLIGWKYTKTGSYTVKSGYWLQTHLPNQVHDFLPPPGLIEFKSAIWKLKTAPKLKHFCWRMITKTLSVGTILRDRHITMDTQCKRCCAADESLEHLFFSCPYAAAIWRGSQVGHASYFDCSLSFEDKFRIILACHTNMQLDAFSRQLPLWILWRLWKSCNMLVHQRRSGDWSRDLHYAINDAFEWSSILQDSGYIDNVLTGVQGHDGWKKPNPGFIKCNYDCRFLQEGNDVSAAWILRDSDGFYMSAAKSRGQGCSTVLEAELQSLLMAMQHVWICGQRRVIFEGDNDMVLKLVSGMTRNFELYNLVREIDFWKQKFEEVSFTWSPRSCNKPADTLARQPFPPNVSFILHNLVPNCIIHNLHEDHVFSTVI